MAILKCKMCGGDLNITAEEKIIECEYCGSTQTIPDGSDEKKTNLFNRANRLRMDNEFDKAAGVYESIVSEFPEEAEGYWGLVLCSYGIEYVDDSKTGKKIPTCHRTLTSSVMDDDNFTQACENADVVARGVYREEAKAIDRLQQQIIAVVENEEPYDVFICYKETDDITKSRTEDSLIAQDIYTELIKEGYKVFFSRVTLRDKAGTEYEPYIYAALKSAKIMLAIGTKFDYYDAVWVKNEWSRYISMMADDSSKHLIPCFKNLDAYDIPKEFKNLQALDMGEVTFFKNLTDNVERFIPKHSTEKTKIVETQADSNSATVDSLLKRAFMFLEEGSWDKADEYCEKVLDINPECAEAYLGKLMTNTRTRRQNELSNLKNTFEKDANYQKICCFGSAVLKNELEGYINFINKRNKEEDNEKIYLEAIRHMEEEKEDNCRSAITLMEQISDYKDAKDLLTEYRARLEKFQESTKQFQKILEPYYIQSRQTYISAGGHHSIALQKNGKVAATNLLSRYCHENPCDIYYWNDIIAISAGYEYTIGLRKDGTVIATGDEEYGAFADVFRWSDIVAISAGWHHAVGIKSNGTVVAVEDMGDNDGRCDVQEWTNIVGVATGWYHTVGLKKDGTVIATKYTGKDENYCGQCDVSDWRNIVAISAGEGHTVGLRGDGTVIAVGKNNEGQCDVSAWKDIVAISSRCDSTVGLKSDGTVVACGSNLDGECNVSNWKDIVAISNGWDNTLGLKLDGSVISTKYEGNKSFYGGQCDVDKFKHIPLPSNKELMKELYAKKEKEARERTLVAEQKRIERERQEEAERIRIAEEKRQEEICLKEQKERQAKYRQAGLCQHCGGEIKGLFVKKCVKCGKKKDY